MATCQFDGTETEKSVCPTCNDYKGLTTTEKQPVFLGSALNDVFAMIEQARQAHKELGCNDPDCNCDDEVVG
jgi:hypothetical protein